MRIRRRREPSFRFARIAGRCIADIAQRRDDDEPPASELRTGDRARSLLREDELRAIETTYADGVTAVQIVDVFTSRGIKFSEASFRKYVQQGLLPRSRRVGRKGKHRGSLGVYPAKTIRRINTVKQLMADGYTIEEIQGQFLLYTDLVESVAERLAELWARLGSDITGLDDERRDASSTRSSPSARSDGDRLVDRLGDAHAPRRRATHRQPPSRRRRGGRRGPALNALSDRTSHERRRTIEHDDDSTT